jgi:hypothetical protein
MAKSKPHKEHLTKPAACACGGAACGVDKTHQQIFQSRSNRYHDHQGHMLEIHKRWKRFGKLAAAGRL